MKLEPLGIEGAWRVELEPNQDDRGWFARTYDDELLRRHGVDLPIRQSSASFNLHRHTLRGIHHQLPPAEETKLIRCTRGAVYDVAVDIRPDSPTYCQWVGVTLGPDDFLSILLPPGVAHGFLTLEDRTEVVYDISPPYEPTLAAGVRWDDPAFGIDWPAEPSVISERDRSLPDFEP